ncbi:MAG: DUF4097 domain-containing protein [Firmicutes bacterium]|nr:DUF4097 domain-containing protein [Bacillota bacterium]
MKSLSMKRLAIAGGILFLCGAIVCVIAFGIAGWDYKKLSTRAPLEQKSAVYDNTNQNITLFDSNVKVTVNKSNDDKIHIDYQESEDLHYTITTTPDVIKFEKKDDYEWYQHLFIIHFEWPSVTIFLPDDYSGILDLTTSNDRVELKNIDTSNNITIKTSNARINLEDVTANKIDVQTSNGRVDLENIKANKIDVQTSNGRIQAKNTESLSSTELKTSNGNINITSLKSNGDIVLRTSNGDIGGSIIGNKDDYKITSHTSNSSNNIPSVTPVGYTKNLTATTSNGKINIQFV